MKVHADWPRGAAVKPEVDTAMAHPPIILPNGDAVAPRALTSIALIKPDWAQGWRVIVGFDRGANSKSIYIALDVADETEGDTLRHRLVAEWRGALA